MSRLFNLGKSSSSVGKVHKSSSRKGVFRVSYGDTEKEIKIKKDGDVMRAYRGAEYVGKILPNGSIINKAGLKIGYKKGALVKAHGQKIQLDMTSRHSAEDALVFGMTTKHYASAQKNSEPKNPVGSTSPKIPGLFSRLMSIRKPNRDPVPRKYEQSEDDEAINIISR